MSRQTVDNREFVITWTRGTSLQEVADTLKMTVAGIKGRAKVMRKAGVNLKKFTGVRKKLTAFDVAQLNDLIKKTERG